MKYDLMKLRARLSAEARGLRAELARLDDHADGYALRLAELRLRDCIANARAVRNLVEAARDRIAKEAAAAT